MKKNLNILLASISFAILIILAGSCSGNSSKDANSGSVPGEEKITAEPEISKETSLLLDDLKENGDYVNSRLFPSLIKSSSVKEELEGNIHIIDIREQSEFNKGHLPGAVNMTFEMLPDYLVSEIKPFEFERIIIVSADGQLAAYTTSILRLMGYGNVYALRWGMSGWNPKFAEEGWFKGCSSDFQSGLETQVNIKPPSTGMPLINIGLSSGAEISAERFRILFEEGFDRVMIEAREVFADPSGFFVINYDRRDKYESGHIPGAVRYKPGATLGIISEMSSIPDDKTVVIYCGTGHNSGFVTAYLRLFGYDARTLKYGNNSFMHDKMKSERATLSWLPFTSEATSNYDYVN